VRYNIHMTKKQIKIISITLLAMFSLLFGFIPNNSSAGKGRDDKQVRIERISDGDTITVRIDGRSEKIRLIGIDAPELGQRPWGKKAKEHLESLIEASSLYVTLEYDVVRRDKYARLLSYVRTADGKLINAEMLRDGYAVLFTFPPNVKHVDQFIEAQRQARDRKIGIWGKNGLDQLPVDYRKEHPRLR
jgi:micrococcal nuclease